MRKVNYVVLCVFLFIFLVAGKKADASIIRVGKMGEVTVNVLSAEDTGEDLTIPESIKISKSSVEMGEADVPISLFRKDGKYILNVVGKSGEKSFDVTKYQDNILEIEERPSIKKIGISLFNNQFVIEQSGIKASTPYQINVEPQRSRITILTSTGYKFLTLLPMDAVDILFKTNTISSLENGNLVQILEDGEGNLYYEAKGIKKVGIKNVYTFDVPVSAKISAVSGEVMEVNQPIWLKIFSLFELQS